VAGLREAARELLRILFDFQNFMALNWERFYRKLAILQNSKDGALGGASASLRRTRRVLQEFLLSA
jgi:hypothetical protein